MFYGTRTKTCTDSLATNGIVIFDRDCVVGGQRSNSCQHNSIRRKLQTRLEWTATVTAGTKTKSEKVPISRTPQTCHGPPPRQDMNIYEHGHSTGPEPLEPQYVLNDVDDSCWCKWWHKVHFCYKRVSILPQKTMLHRQAACCGSNF